VDRVELALIAAFCAIAAWPATLDVIHAAGGRLLWTGTTGIYIQDDMQYLAWIKDASRHLLVSDMFVVHGTPHDFLQPLVALSGGLVALGMAPWLALELWQPVAVIVALVAVRWLIHRLLARPNQRRAALALALFGGAVATHPDLWLPFWSWGYPFGLIALAAMISALAICAGTAPNRRARLTAAGLALLGSWLHPWQGETLVLILLAGLGLSRRPGFIARLGRLDSTAPPALDLRCAAWVICASALPLGYYAALGLLDEAWRRGATIGANAPSAWLVALYLAPLGLPALLGYRRAVAGRLDLLVRCWPPAALAVLIADLNGLGSTPTHAMLGISVPLGILAVAGVSEARIPSALRTAAWIPSGLRACARRRALAIMAVAAVTVPACAFEMAKALPLISPRADNGNFIAGGDAEALSYLARDRRRGAVLTDYGLGLLVPGQTGRRTYLGDTYWTPNSGWRGQQVFLLMGGYMAPRRARAFVRSTGATFVLSDCRSRHPPPRSLAPLVARTRHFGCATLLVLRGLRE
jgi:hypothetical protein